MSVYKSIDGIILSFLQEVDVERKNVQITHVAPCMTILSFLIVFYVAMHQASTILL